MKVKARFVGTVSSESFKIGTSFFGIKRRIDCFEIQMVELDAESSSVGDEAPKNLIDGAQYHPYPSGSTNGSVIEKLDHELASSNIHRLQLRSNWRQVLVKEKFQELHDELPQLIQHHDENVAWKKQVIDSYQTGIQDLLRLHQNARVTNRKRNEELIAIHNDQVAKLEHDFRARVSSLQSQSHSDLAAINAQYDHEKEVIRLFLQRHEAMNDAEIQSLHQKHWNELDTVKRRNVDQMKDVRSNFDSKIKEIECQLQETHDEFAQNTNGTRTAYAQLKSKDDALRKDVASKMKHASTLQREIQRFQLISMQEEAQIQEIHEELLARKSRAIAKLNLMQTEMTRFREEQQTRLADLIRRANEQKEALQLQCAVAVRVEKIALFCQQMESSREKFASMLRGSTFPSDMPSNGDDGEDFSGAKHKSEQKAIIINCMGRLGDTTHHFWNKYNIAQLDVLTLERNVLKLKEREDDLRKKLKTYHDGITVNDDVLKNPNPLFVINGKINSTPKKTSTPAKDRRRLTVVDGDHFFVTNSIAQSE